MISKSIIIWVIAITLVAHVSYNISAITVTDDYRYLIWVIGCFTAAVGLIFSKSWSQYLVYLISLSTAGGWAFVVIHMAINDWHYSGVQQTILSLIPGLLLVSVCVLFSVFVYKYFNKQKVKT